MGEFGLNSVDRVVGIFVFPDSYHGPTRIPQSTSGLDVAGDIAFELLYPPVGVGLRESGVLRTTMPEAPVDKHGDSLPSEGDVRPCSAEFGDAQVDSITKPSPVQLSSNCHLGIGARIANP